MTKRTLKQWIEAMKLCKDNDIAFSVSGPGLIEFIELLDFIANETINTHPKSKKQNG